MYYSVPKCGYIILTSNKVEHRTVVVFLNAQAIHDGMNCKQYQEQVKQESETNAEARRTKEMLEVRRYVYMFCFHFVELFGSPASIFVVLNYLLVP
jgi:hypothetical protein